MATPLVKMWRVQTDGRLDPDSEIQFKFTAEEWQEHKERLSALTTAVYEERELIRERTLAGLKVARGPADARAAGSSRGRKPRRGWLSPRWPTRPVTLYRYVGPQGQLREQGQKVLASCANNPLAAERPRPGAALSARPSTVSGRLQEAVDGALGWRRRRDLECESDWRRARDHPGGIIGLTAHSCVSLTLESCCHVSLSNLTLNFAPVTLTGDTTLNIGYRPYTEDGLNELRAKHGPTHVFKRDGTNDTIIDIPVAAGTEPLSDKSMAVDLKERPRYWGPLLNAALVRAFAGKREIASDYPVEIWWKSREALSIRLTKCPSRT